MPRYAYSYRTLCVAILAHYYTRKIIHHAIMHIYHCRLKSCNDLKACIDHAPCECFVCTKGDGHSVLSSGITIPRHKQVNLSTRLLHYMPNSSFSNVIDHKATKVLCTSRKFSWQRYFYIAILEKLHHT